MNGYRHYTMEEKRDKVASAKKIRETDPTMSWQAIADYLKIPLSTIKSWVNEGIDGGKRGRPPGEVVKMVKSAVNEVFDERGIPRKGET